jgi:hypothetical protein
MNKPVMCPLCGQNPAGPSHRLAVCPGCHQAFVADQNKAAAHQIDPQRLVEFYVNRPDLKKGVKHA